jgi:hypothetical protein
MERTELFKYILYRSNRGQHGGRRRGMNRRRIGAARA